jgi:hypothetical protein
VRALGLVDAVAYKQISAGLVKQAFKRDIDEIERDVPRSQRRQYRRPRPPLESLTEEQRATLDLLGQFDGGWGSGCDGRYWLELLGLPQCPPEMREYLGYPPPPPNLLDRVVAIDEFEGPLWRFLPTVCVADGSARARQAALSLVSVIAPDEAVELVILGKRVKVPSAWRGTELFIHHLVAQGKAVVPHLEAALDRFRREGPLGYWGYGIRGGHTPTRNHRYQTGREPLILFIALRVLVPEAPSSWLEGAGHHVSADMLMRNLASFGSEAAAWIDAALAATT